MADFCGQLYAEWKQRLVEAFVLPYTDERCDAMEVAPGHGRWSNVLAQRCRSVVLVDLSQSCIDACRERLANRVNVNYVVNDGRHLPGAAETIDFIWSFDSFVHMDPPVVGGYLDEFSRVLRQEGIAVIHHAGKRPLASPLRHWLRRIGRPGSVLERLVAQGRLRDSGNRSDISAKSFAEMAEGAGLKVLFQTDCWGPTGGCSVRKYRDVISVLGATEMGREGRRADIVVPQASGRSSQ